MRSLSLSSASCLVCLLLSASGSAQQSGSPPGFSTETVPWGMGAAKTYSTHGSVLLLTVFGDNKAHLDRQAVVKLSNLLTHDVVWQTTADNSEAQFGDLAVGKYEIEVSAFGYLSEHAELPVVSAINTYRREITLKRDPSAVDLKAQTAKLPSKARKATLRGISALKSSNLKEAQKQFDTAHKLAPSSSEVNFLQGFLSYQKKDFKKAEIYLNSASALDPHNSAALTLLGRLRLVRADYPAAQMALEQAIAADADSWMAHNLLADAYLRQNEFAKARVQAQLAIDKGKGGANAAELPLGEALANLGQPKEAIQALNRFLQYTPKSASAPQVRELIAELERPDLGGAGDSINAVRPPLSLSRSQGIDPVLATTEPELAVKGWEPPGIDDVRPPVAANVVCPSETVIKSTGDGVKEFVEDVSRFNAIEDLEHKELNQLGETVRKETRKFNYVVSISEPRAGFLSVDEFRSGVTDVGDFPDQIATRGVPALALVFHPDMVDNFQVTCEGLGQWNGKATWLLYFRQRQDRPNRIRSYKIGSKSYPVDLKGRAWVTAETYHIVRIESELVSPVKQVQLLSERYTVDYAPVKFQKKNVELWLPKNAELYFQFRKHRYFRRHTFDDFMLFSVDTEEKTKGPKGKVEPPISTHQSL